MIQGHINCSDALKYDKRSACAKWQDIYLLSHQAKKKSALGKINEQAVSRVRRGTKKNWWAVLWDSSIISLN